MVNSKKVMGIVFSNMHDSLIPELTSIRTMGSVPFGGRYRLIDFALSNLVNSEVFDVGLITKANYHSLMQHIGAGTEWDLDRKHGGLQLLPPFGDANFGMYRGKMEALGAALNFMRSSNAKYVVATDCDFVTNIDLREAIEYFIDSEADITLLCRKGYVNADVASSGTFVTLDENKNVIGVDIDPAKEGDLIIFMDIFIMKKDFMEDLVTDCLSKGVYSFDRDILQKRHKELKINAFIYDTYMRKMCSMKNYFLSNMEMLDKSVRDQVFNPNRTIFTKIHDEVPVKYGLDCDVSNSFIADGSIIEGQVENSVISRGVHIKKGAKVKNSVIMRGCVIGQKSEVNYAVTDHYVNVLDYRTLSGSQDFPVFVAKGATV